jgi:hypothetical protein
VRYWDEDSLRWIEGEVVWDGSHGPSPAEIRSRECWYQVRNDDRKEASNFFDLPSQKETKGKACPDVPFGGRVVGWRMKPGRCVVCDRPFTEKQRAQGLRRCKQRTGCR